MEKTISSTLLHKGKSFSFYHDKVRFPNGKESERNTVKHPGAVAIIAIQDDEIVLINQFRYATGKYLLEIPAGTLEINEDPLQCAVRELKEETGFIASSWSKLFHCYMVPGYSDEVLHFYLAEDLKFIGFNPDEDEDISILSYKLENVIAMIEKNEIEDAKTIIGALTYMTRIIP